MTKPVLWLDELGAGDVAVVGGKNASLGEMIRKLGAAGVAVPPGFATTAEAFRDYIAANGIGQAIADRLAAFRAGLASLAETGAAIRRLFLDGHFPEPTARAIVEAYRGLAARTGIADPAVAVRSSATAEDLPNASFAGQQETFLNVVGERAVLDACRHCYASLYTDRAISYREMQGFAHEKVALSVGVQLMVRADRGAAGIMFTLDTESGFPGVVVISANWGLGEPIVQGAVNPDRYLVFKPALDDPAKVPILEMQRGEKRVKMVYAEGGSARTALVETTGRERDSLVLSASEILALARWGAAIERHYGRPMDINGPRTESLERLRSCRRARRRCMAVARAPFSGPGVSPERRDRSCAALRWARRSPRGQHGSCATRLRSTPFRKVPYWSPRRPTLTGCR
jgi:pyruvate,water dikinase